MAFLIKHILLNPQDKTNSLFSLSFYFMVIKFKPNYILVGLPPFGFDSDSGYTQIYALIFKEILFFHQFLS